MRLVFIFVSCFMMFSTSAQALTLVCTMQGDNIHEAKTVGAGYNQRQLDNWVPRKQTHVIDLDKKTAFFKGEEFKANLEDIDEKIIGWTYDEVFHNKERTNSLNVRFRYIYFRKTNVIAVNVDFGSYYRKMVSKKSSCVEK